MPQVQAPTTLLAVNACNDTTFSGVADRTLGNADLYGDQLSGLYFDMTNGDAALVSDTAIGTLYEGRYRRVQVDSGATASNVKTGTIGLMSSLAAVIADGDATGKPTVNIVTSYDQAIGNSAGGVRPVVFLNQITPGNFGYIQELGTATVLGKTGLTAAAPAVGDVIVSATSGLVDDPTQSGSPTYATLKTVVGVAIDLPKSNGLFRVLLSQAGFPVVQE
jgi:hypothetical protein